MQSLLERLKLAENEEKSNIKIYLLQGFKPLCSALYKGGTKFAKTQLISTMQ